VADIGLDWAAPPDEYARYVTLFYRISADLPLRARPLLAAGAHLRVHFAENSIGYGFSEDRPIAADAPTGRLYLVAPTPDPPRITADAPVRLLGIELSPLGWAALIGERSVGPLIDAGAILGNGATRLAAALAPQADASAMAAAAAPLLASLMAEVDPAIAAFVDVVDAWLAQGPPFDVAVLVEATGLSRRQVERRCNWLYGGPPALIARKRRALRAARLLADGIPGRDVLTASDFYDQSHFIREMKRFTGMTPGQLGQGALLLPSVVA